MNRLSVNISADTETVLRELAAAEDVSITEAVRRLVGYGSIVYQTDRDGGDVLLRGKRRTDRVVLND